MSKTISKSANVSAIKKVLPIGKEYFDNVEQCASYLGEGQIAFDSAEVLLLLIGLNGQYIQRQNLVDMLCIDVQKVKKAIAFLKSKDLIVSSKKGLLWTKKYPTLSSSSTDDVNFEVFGFFYTIGYWYADLDNFWKVMTFIHTLKDWVGGVAECAKRQLAMALCKGKVEGFTYTKTKQFNKVIDSLNWDILNEKYILDTYRTDMEEKTIFDKERRRCLAIYQKAKYLLIHPNIAQKEKLPSYIPTDAKYAYDLAMRYFPYNDKEKPLDTLNKQNLFIYEYLVHQPILGDEDFFPTSPFYGQPLSERLKMLKDTIGKSSKVYNRGFLTLPQWRGIFNGNRSKTYLKALNTKVWWDKKKKGKKKNQP